MSKKSLSEIIAYIQRESDVNEVREELDVLRKLYTESSDPKLYEYVPVKIVAIIQDYFRKKYKEIMDNPDYRKNISGVKEFKNISFDPEILGGFQDSEITMGDYLSYLIPCNNIESINNTISQLLDINFLNKFKTEYNDAAQIIETITVVFTNRHMYCHEVPKVKPLTFVRITQMINAAEDFINKSENILFSIGDSVDDPYAFIEQLKDEYNKRNVQLDSIVSTFKKNHPEDELFSGMLNFIDEWKTYRDARGNAAASVTKDAAATQILYYVTVEQLTAEFIRELNKYYRGLIYH